MWHEYDRAGGGNVTCLACGHVVWNEPPEPYEPERQITKRGDTSRAREIIRLQYRERMNRRREVASANRTLS